MSKPICHSFAGGLVFLLAATCSAGPTAAFLGAKSCSSSSCHGGGGANQNQYLVWSLKDFHSQRPAATLTTARAKQIADALEIKDASADERCTSCHAPLNSVPATLRGQDFDVSEGVSCESCHGPAENWLRSHTRSDYTRADRTAAGMRDLQDLYVRANSCVACHQVVLPPLLKAGHPELIFELDGQSVAEPKHWCAEKNGNGAQAWLVGQAVALREMSWELSREPVAPESEINRWRALVWLMSRLSSIDTNLPLPPGIVFQSGSGTFTEAQKWSDKLARTAASLTWTDDISHAALTTLVGSSADFRQPVPQAISARRAERLVLALDRLLVGHTDAKIDNELNQLFKEAQSLPEFESTQFAETLDSLSSTVGPRRQ